MEEVTTDREGEEVVIYLWLSKFYIIAALEEFGLIEINTHDRIGDRVTPEFKEMLNKCQPINLKIKNKIRK